MLRLLSVCALLEGIQYKQRSCVMRREVYLKSCMSLVSGWSVPLQQAVHPQVCCDKRCELFWAPTVSHHVSRPWRSVEGVYSTCDVSLSKQRPASTRINTRFVDFIALARLRKGCCHVLHVQHLQEG